MAWYKQLGMIQTLTKPGLEYDEKTMAVRNSVTQRFINTITKPSLGYDEK
jgi:hypothetical protein